MKKNYRNLNVDFDLWKGESDAQKYIPAMIDRLKKEGYAYMDQGALVIDVKEASDTKEIPPCMIQKSDGASLYGTTDLATLVQREEDYHPDKVIYIVDKRQELHFIPGIPCGEEDGDCAGVHGTYFPGIRNPERKRRQAFQNKGRRRDAPGESDCRDYGRDV